MQENKAMTDLANKLNNKTKTFFDTGLIYPLCIVRHL